MLNIARAALATASTRNDRAEGPGWLPAAVEKSESRVYVTQTLVFPPPPRGGMLFEIAFRVGDYDVLPTVIVGVDELPPLNDPASWSYRAEMRGADAKVLNWNVYTERKPLGWASPVGPFVRMRWKYAQGSTPPPFPTIRYLGEGIADTPGFARASGGESPFGGGNPFQNPYRGMMR